MTTNIPNFKPIPTITVTSDYWQNGTWKFNAPEITAGSAYAPSYLDVIVSGIGALTLVNSMADGLNYVRLFGGTELIPETYIDSVTAEGKCEQADNPTLSTPQDIKCNNGVIKASMQLLVNGNLANSTTNWDIASGVVYTDTADYAQFYNSASNLVYCRCIPPTRIVGHKYAYLLKGYVSLQSGNSSWGSRNAGSFGQISTTDTLMAGIDEFPSGGGGNPWISLPTGTTAYINKSAGFRMYDLTALGLDTTITTAQDVIDYFGDTYREPKEPYVDGTTETITDNAGNVATCQNLLSVGTYKDTQEIISGVVTRNVSIKVLDGTESWISQLEYSRYTIVISNLDSDGTNLYCTHLKDSTAAQGNCRILSAQRICFYVGDTYTTVDAWKEFLAQQYAAGTPVIVVYPTSSATTETVDGQVLTKAPVTAVGSISDLVATAVTSSHTIPTPSEPLQLKCNNGTIKVSPNLWKQSGLQTSEVGGVTYTPNADGTISVSGTATEYGTYALTNFTIPESIKNETITISGLADAVNITWGSIVLKSSNNTNINTFTSTSTITIDLSQYPTASYITVGIKRQNNAAVSGTVKPQIEVGSTATTFRPYGSTYVDGTVEKVDITGNLVDFNETRINSSNWDSADKTKGFEVYADVYGKSVGDTMLTNANAFGVFVPCAYGKSVSMNFFNYSPFANRALYCEITADRKCNTLPVEYYNTTTSTWNNYTFTVTKTDSIGFIIEFFINAQQTRNYTKENYTVIKGTTQPTAYIPYFNGGTATTTNLLKVGDYKDVQSVLDGAVTRNVGVKVLDGTELWSSNDVGTGGYIRFNYKWTVAPKKIGFDVLTNTFVSQSAVVGPDATSAVISGHGTNQNIYLAFPANLLDGDLTTSAGRRTAFNNWLADQYNAGTPVIILYPLDTATTESVTGQPLTTQAGTNIVSITQASIDNLALEVSYKAGVTVTIEEVENAQLDNSVEVTIS